MRRHRSAPGRARGPLTGAGARRCTRRTLLAGLAGLPLAACRRTANTAPVRADFVQFGTLTRVSLWRTDAAAAERAIAALRNAYAALDRDWYAWGEGQLGRVNAALARGTVAACDAALGRLVGRALELGERSGGLFDVRIGPLVALWGFAGAPSAGDELPEPGAIARARRRAAIGVRAESGVGGSRIVADAPGALIDVGGIAKGAILARGLALLRGQGVPRALIDAGGDVAGYDDGGVAAPFRVGIRPARAGGPVRALALAPGEAVTTSGDYARYRQIGGRRFAHIIDPRTGWPAATARSATVVHRDAELADAAATALIVGGAGAFDAVCDAMRVDSALLVDNRGEMRASDAMRARLAKPGEH